MIPLNNIMLDMETLSTEPDAAVFEIALVEFTPAGIGEHHLSMPFMPETGHIDPQTVRWWLCREEPCALKSTQLISEAEAVQMVFRYLQQRDEFMLWAQPSSFDCVILQSLLKRHGHTMPIGFRKWRDVRTVRELADWPKTEYREGQTAHSAFGDCVRQIDTLFACWKALR